MGACIIIGHVSDVGVGIKLLATWIFEFGGLSVYQRMGWAQGIRVQETVLHSIQFLIGREGVERYCRDWSPGGHPGSVFELADEQRDRPPQGAQDALDRKPLPKTVRAACPSVSDLCRLDVT